MLIKTDSQNYTDIANAIRGLTGGTEQYKPEEMADAIGTAIPDYGISYNSYNSNGSVSSATTYGYKVVGLAGSPYDIIINFSDEATEIGEYAFVMSDIRTIELPNTITKIGEGAFYNSSLTTITLPDMLTEIDEYAFYSCDNLSISSIPEKVTEIKTYTFSYCTFTSFTFHKNIKKIDRYAFNWSELINVTFEGTPTEINADAFYHCTDLATINVPWSEGEVANAPWGATNATINYNYVT